MHFVIRHKIYLSNCLLVVEHEQWGLTADRGDKDYWQCAFPVSMSAAYGLSLQRYGGGKCYSPILINLQGTGFSWTDRDQNDKHGGGDIMSYIVAGT